MERVAKVEVYAPKGGMCVNCRDKLKYCAGLHFEDMPVIKVIVNEFVITKIVKCTEFKKNDK